MRFIVLVVVFSSLAATSGCSVGRSVTIPNTASAALRQDLAGKTLECAGKARQSAGYATAGAIVTSVGQSVYVGFVTTLNPNPTVELAIFTAAVAVALSGATVGLGIYALVMNIEAAETDQKAGRALAGDSFDGCSLSDDPREPVAPSSPVPGGGSAIPAVVVPAPPPAPATTFEECRAQNGQWVPFANECKLP